MNSLYYTLSLLAVSGAVSATPATPPFSPAEEPAIQMAVQRASPGPEIPSMERNIEVPDVNVTVREAGPFPADALLPGNPAGSYVLAPRGLLNGSFSIKEGCWAKVSDEDGLQGDALILLGPMEIPDVAGRENPGIRWRDRISTIQTDVHAQITIYDNTGFQDPLFTIQPGQIFNVNNAIKTFGEIRSLKIACINR